MKHLNNISVDLKKSKKLKYDLGKINFLHSKDKLRFNRVVNKLDTLELVRFNATYDNIVRFFKDNSEDIIQDPKFKKLLNRYHQVMNLQIRVLDDIIHTKFSYYSCVEYRRYPEDDADDPNEIYEVTKSNEVVKEFFCDFPKTESDIILDIKLPIEVIDPISDKNELVYLKIYSSLIFNDVVIGMYIDNIFNNNDILVFNTKIPNNIEELSKKYNCQVIILSNSNIEDDVKYFINTLPNKTKIIEL